MPSIGISLANVLLILSLAFDSEWLLYAALFAWFVGLVALLIQNKNKSKFKSIAYTLLSIGVLCVTAFMLWS